MSTEGTSGEMSSGSDGSKKRKTRGKNMIDYNKIEKAKAIGVAFNELGQPIGEASKTFSSACGVLVAQNIPIVYESWLKVPEMMKDTLWETTKVRFGLDDSVKGHTLQQMGQLWRAHKHRLTVKIRSAAGNLDSEQELQMLRPINITEEDWDKFIQHRLSSEFKALSRSYSELSKKNTTPHTTSRKGMARLREELRAGKVAEGKDPNEISRVDLWSAGHKHKDGTPVNECAGIKISEMEEIQKNVQQSTSSLKDDALAQVLGDEHRGRVRGMGFGATPSVVYASVLGRKKDAHLEEKVNTLMQQMLVMQNFIMTQANIDPNQFAAFGFAPTQVSRYSSGSSPMGGDKSAKLNESFAKTSSQANVSQDESSSRLETRCQLLDWSTQQVVAEAEIDCKDPHATVHHEILGPDCWRVCVKKVMVSIPLWRSTTELQNLDDAINTFIAWPKLFIRF